MGGSFNVGGLVTGLDSETLIAQLMQLEQQPLLRLEDRINTLQAEQEAVRGLRTQLQTLRNRAQDFRLINVFDTFESTSSAESVVTSEISGSSPVLGSFEIDVQQLATATVANSGAVIGGAINTSAALDSSGITTSIEAGTFTINGEEFTVDPATDSLDGVLAAINGSAAGVTASYDAGTDTVVIENSTPGDTSLINLGATEDTSNFLDAIAVTEATQSTNAGGSTEVSSTRHLGAIDAVAVLNTQNFANGAVTAGTFSINGIEITVDPSSDTLVDVIGYINSSDAGVTASYDAASDGIRFVSDRLGSRTIGFGGAGDTSNFLSVMNLDTATQTAGSDAQFTINGGPVQTRNTNEVSDAISGVTFNMLSVGTGTVTVDSDDDAVVESVQEFVDEFNASLSQLQSLTASSGTLSNDSSIRSIANFLQSNIFDMISGFGDYQSLVDIGITTGEDFDSSATMQLQLDEEAFREALREDSTNVERLFHNEDGTGIADVYYEYLEEATKATGFLNTRAKANGTIDQQIRSLNDQIDRTLERLEQKEDRLRRQFTQMEQMAADYQSQGSALSAFGGF